MNTNELSGFFSVDNIPLCGEFEPGTLAHRLIANSNWENADLALIAVQEGLEPDSDWSALRHALYSLYPGDNIMRICDLGDLQKGATEADSMALLGEVCATLLNEGVVPVIIAKGHHFTLGQYRAFQVNEQNIRAAIIDDRIDLLPRLNVEDPSSNFIEELISSEPPMLDDLACLGYQTHYTPGLAIETLDKLKFSAHRFGAFRSNIRQFEPLLRDAHMLSFDMSALRQADFPGQMPPSPNGFNAEDACQITSFAGSGECIRSLGIYGADPAKDSFEYQAALVAQMLWYFFEGFYQRKGDYPIEEQQFIKYHVHLGENDPEVEFWKSKKSNRWWIRMPNSSGELQLLPCLIDDYLEANKGNIPDRLIDRISREEERLHRSAEM